MLVDEDNATSPVQLKGFCIDMLRVISEMVGFKYEIYLVEDGVYGIRDPDTGKWSGLVGDLIDKVTA
jgi:hypothetical protein